MVLTLNKIWENVPKVCCRQKWVSQLSQKLLVVDVWCFDVLCVDFNWGRPSLDDQYSQLYLMTSLFQPQIWLIETKVQLFHMKTYRGGASHDDVGGCTPIGVQCCFVIKPSLLSWIHMALFEFIGDQMKDMLIIVYNRMHDLVAAVRWFFVES